MKKRIKANARFVYKSKTAAEWQAENPILLNGEIGFVSDAHEIDFLKVGDGITNWNNLPYKNATDQTYDPQSERAQSGKAVCEALKGAELENYVKKTDIASGTTVGVIKAEPDDLKGLGVSIIQEGENKGFLKITPANRGDIAGKRDEYIRPLTPGNIDYIILKGLTENQETWQEYEKKAARELIGAVGNTDYPTYDTQTNKVTPGVVSTRPDDGWGLGIETIADGWQKGYLRLKPADNGDIAGKIAQYRPIVPSTVDYAVLKALTDSKITWNDEEKTKARTLIGAAGLDVIAKGAITTESYYEEAYIELEASALYVFIHNSGSNNIELKLQNSAGTYSNPIDCSRETTPAFQAGAVLVPKDIASPLQLKADSQGNLTVYDYLDRTALLMGVTGKTLGVPQMATKQFYYDASNTGDKADMRVNYGKMFAHNKTGSLTVWKIKL